MIEDTITKLADAINRLCDVLESVDDSAPVKPAKKNTSKKPEKKPETEEQPSIDDVRSVLTKLKRDQAREVLSKFDVKKLPELDEEKYQEAINEAEQLLKAA